MAIVAIILSFKKGDQVPCQANRVVSQLLQTARSEHEMEVLLVRNVRLGLAEAAQNIVAIGINGSSTMAALRASTGSRRASERSVCRQR